MAAVEQFLEGHFVNQAAAGAIDDADARLALQQIFAAEDVAGAVGERRVQADEIGAGQQFVERHLGHAHMLGAFRGEERIEGDHLHLQAQRAIGDDAADVAGADQAQCLGRHFDAHEAVLLPLAGLGGGIGFRQLASEREHQGDGVFGGGDAVAEWRVHHDDAERGSGRDIDIVNPDAGAAHHLQIGGGGEHLLGDLGGGADGEAIIIADDLDQLVLRQAGDFVHFDAAGAEDFGGLGGHLIGNEDFGHGVLLREYESGVWAGKRAEGTAAAQAAVTSAWAQSSQWVSATTSAVSTVAPHQMRRPAGASR